MQKIVERVQRAIKKLFIYKKSFLTRFFYRFYSYYIAQIRLMDIPCINTVESLKTYVRGGGPKPGWAGKRGVYDESSIEIKLMVQLAIDRVVAEGLRSLHGDTMSLPVVGPKENLTATIDTDDYPAASRMRWYSDGYHVWTIHSNALIPFKDDVVWVSKRHARTLHGFCLGTVDGHVVDHINGDTLDNRKQNLRHVSVKANCGNKKVLPREWLGLCISNTSVGQDTLDRLSADHESDVELAHDISERSHPFIQVDKRTKKLTLMPFVYKNLGQFHFAQAHECFETLDAFLENLPMTWKGATAADNLKMYRRKRKRDANGATDSSSDDEKSPDPTPCN